MTQKDVKLEKVIGCEFHVALLKQKGNLFNQENAFKGMGPGLHFNFNPTTFFTNAYAKADSHGLAFHFFKIEYLNLIQVRIH